MQMPLEIAYRNVEKTDRIDDLIRQKVAKLEQVCDHLVSCHVAVEKPQEHQESGNPYRIRIDMRVPPQHELVVKQNSGEGEMHEGLDTVVRRAFERAQRQLRDLTEQQQGQVKRHADRDVTGHIERVFRSEGYGFVRALDGREIYFTRGSLPHDDFEEVEVGMGVRHIEQPGEKGPQASTVEVVDRPGPGGSNRGTD